MSLRVSVRSDRSKSVGGSVSPRTFEVLSDIAIVEPPSPGPVTPEPTEQTLHDLAGLGAVAAVSKRLADGTGGVNQTDEYGNTLLHVAASRGFLVLARELVSTFKADLSFRNLACLTPVLVAAQFGQTSTLHLLSELGADLTVKDSMDRTCAHYASQYGRANTVRYLHNRGFDLSCVDKNGNTPLHLIAEANSVDSISLVLKLGGRTDLVNSDGLTPEALATQLGHRKAASAIARFRPPRNSKPQKGELWFYLPWIVPPFLDGSVFATLLFSNLYAVWAGVGLFWAVFFWQFGHRLLPKDGASDNSPFAYAHVITLLLLCGISYFFLFALHLNGPQFLSLHLSFWILAVICGVCFYQCTRSDPGFCDKKNSGLLTCTSVSVPDYGFCESCFIVRPLRSKHCSTCNRCVKVFDHHCPYVNNCVGRNNMLPFFLFLLSSFSALPLYAVAASYFLAPGSIRVLNIDRVGFWVFIGGYLGLHFLFLGSLVLAQIQRILQNRTTAERINQKINPHRYVYLKETDKGVCSNCASFACSSCRAEIHDPEYGKSTADAF